MIPVGRTGLWGCSGAGYRSLPNIFPVDGMSACLKLAGYSSFWRPWQKFHHATIECYKRSTTSKARSNQGAWEAHCLVNGSLRGGCG